MKIYTPFTSYFISARTFVVAGLLIAVLFSCLLVRIALLERENARLRVQIAVMRETTTHAREAM